MLATRDPGRRLRLAGYGALLAFVFFGAFMAAIAPRTAYEELKVLADAGWQFPTLGELTRPEASASASGYAADTDPDRMDYGNITVNRWQGIGPWTSAMLALLLLGALGWLESNRWSRRQDAR